jgi:hypothetical protein
MWCYVLSLQRHIYVGERRVRRVSRRRKNTTIQGTDNKKREAGQNFSH